MVTSFSLLTRRAGLSPEEFRAHWRDVHAPLVGHVDYLRGYVQHRFPPPEERVDPAEGAGRLDGLAEFWWDDRAAALRPVADPRYTDHAQPDEPRFLDMARLHAVQTVPLRLGGSSANVPAARIVRLLVRRPGLSDDDFRDRLATAWSAAAAGRDCVLHVSEHTDGAMASLVDAIVTCAWRDEPGSPRPDDGSDPARSITLLDDAHVVIAPPAQS
jgi:EthD domain-containing protein